MLVPFFFLTFLCCTCILLCDTASVRISTQSPLNSEYSHVDADSNDYTNLWGEENGLSSGESELVVFPTGIPNDEGNYYEYRAHIEGEEDDSISNNFDSDDPLLTSILSETTLPSIYSVAEYSIPERDAFVEENISSTHPSSDYVLDDAYTTLTIDKREAFSTQGDFLSDTEPATKNQAFTKSFREKSENDVSTVPNSSHTSIPASYHSTMSVYHQLSTLTSQRTEDDSDTSIISPSDEEKTETFFPTTTTEDPCENKTPENVKSFRAEPNVSWVMLRWNLTDPACVTKYVLAVEGMEEVELLPIETSYNYTHFSNYSKCESYVAKITAFNRANEGPPETTSFSLTLPSHLGAVTNLSLSTKHDKLIATWTPPSGESLCVSRYRLNIGPMKTLHTNDTRYETDIVWCQMFSIQIIPLGGKNGEVEGNPVYKEMVMPRRAFKAPSLLSKDSGKTWLEFELHVEPHDSNMCNVTSAHISCDAEDVDDDKKWVKKHVDYLFLLTDNPRRRFSCNLTDVSEFTTYACRAVIINDSGPSLPGKKANGTTKEEVPSEPQGLEITNVDSDAFIIRWQEPDKIPGIMQKYNLTVVNNGPLHFIPEGCINVPESYHMETHPKELFFNFNKALPNFRYTVYVAALDGAGSSESVHTSINTLPSEPEVPRHVTVDEIVIANNITTYEAYQKFFWELPCNTNGIMSTFVMNITGKSTEDDTSHNEIDVILKNRYVEDVEYQYDFQMKPSYNYVFHLYAYLVNGIPGYAKDGYFSSPEGCPTQPSYLEPSIIDNTSFKIAWQKPSRTNGMLLNYVINIESLGPTYPQPSAVICQDHLETVHEEKDNETYHLFFPTALPSHRYKVSVKANTSAGYGLDNVIEFVTLEGVPENVRYFQLRMHNQLTEEYGTLLIINFNPPCNTFGELLYYELSYVGQRDGYPDTALSRQQTSYYFAEEVLPEYTYTVNVAVWNNKYRSISQTGTIISPPGVPSLGSLQELMPPKANGTDQAVFILPKSLFNETNGEILYCALLLEEYTYSQRRIDYGFWKENETWPRPCITLQCINATQLTRHKWSPFSDESSHVTFNIGTEAHCLYNETCNRRLKPATKYIFVVRMFTSQTYRDSPVMQFTTEAISTMTAGSIVGIIFGFLLATALGYFLYILWRRNLDIKELKLIAPEESDSGYIPVKQFVAHYDDLKTNYAKLRAEYALLETKSKELNIPTEYAVLPENKRKNRYTNILPFDTTRVKLQIEEDDEISSDYINASYIRGISGTVEYIATQGPLPGTCKDFWKMVIQERVTIIAMVSQFIETDKQKCHKYFPNNRESMIIGDDMEVRCLTELHFGIYCVRTLQVRKDTLQHNVTHMQFLGWPDFGCPSGTEYMLQFCQQFRERLKAEGGLAVVHCSAGVGRTGTMISIDILLQVVEQGGDINIFETVLELRKQRMNMVQTEKQLFYIYTCIKEYIENPISPTENNGVDGHIYENMSSFRSCCESVSLNQESESAL